MHAYTTSCYPTFPEQVAAGGYLFNPSFEKNHDAPWTGISDADTSTIDDSFSDIRPAFEVLQEIRRMMDARKERERKRAYDRLVGAHHNTPFSTTSTPPAPASAPSLLATTTVHTVNSASEMQRERQKAYDRLVGVDRAPAVDFSRKSFMDLAQLWYRRCGGKGAP